MKYIIVEVLNSRLDACLHHPSGISTCSTGTGYPWIMTLGPRRIFDNREDAVNHMDKLIDNRFKKYKSYIADKNYEIAECESYLEYQKWVDEELVDNDWIVGFRILPIPENESDEKEYLEISLDEFQEAI